MRSKSHCSSYYGVDMCRPMFTGVNNFNDAKVDSVDHVLQQLLHLWVVANSDSGEQNQAPSENVQTSQFLGLSQKICGRVRSQLCKPN